MPERFDLSGRLAVTVEGAEGDALEAVARQLSPFAPSGAPGAGREVVLAQVRAGELPPLVELQGPAGDGLTTGWDGEQLQLVLGERRCTVPDVGVPGPVRIRYEAGIPLARMFRAVVRPALQLALADAAAVHATAVDTGDGAVLVAGWSESGKTEVGLALMEQGGRFLSDKWTVLGTDGEASAFPIGVGVRRWVLDALPRLRAGLPGRARAQLRVAAAVGAAARPLGGRAGELADRAAGLADRAALTPDELRAVYGDDDAPGRRRPLRALVLLETAPGPALTVDEADPALVAARLARTASYERRAFLGLGERARFAAPDAERHDDAPAFVARDERLLAEVLGRATVLRVRTPFPADPRPIAAAVAERL